MQESWIVRIGDDDDTEFYDFNEAMTYYYDMIESHGKENVEWRYVNDYDE